MGTRKSLSKCHSGQSKIKYQHLPNPVRWICQNAIPHGFEEHWRFAVAKTPYRLSIFTSSCVIWLNFFVLGDRFVSRAPRSLFDKALVTMNGLPLVWYANPVRRIRQQTIRHGFIECLNAVYRHSNRQFSRRSQVVIDSNQPDAVLQIGQSA